VSDQRIYLIDVYRKRLTYPQLRTTVVELYQRYSPDKLLIEDKSSGTALIQELQAAGVYGIESYCPPPGSDKQLRFAAQAIKFEAGRVFLPREAPWLEEYVREITGFPSGKYDDQVDSTSQALHHLGDVKDSIGFLDAVARYATRLRIYETC
jgi:predicted phage terminase large subunit-like protein